MRAIGKFSRAPEDQKNGKNETVNKESVLSQIIVRHLKPGRSLWVEVPLYSISFAKPHPGCQVINPLRTPGNCILIGMIGA
jgi:hypothetical protein